MILFSRRAGLVFLISASFFRKIAQAADGSSKDFDGLLQQFQDDINLSQDNYRDREFRDFFPVESLERAPIRAKPSDLKISDKAVDLIVFCEVSSKSLYTLKYEHPVWPGGSSGVTIGIGYDIGYAAEQDIRHDWGGNIADSLKSACGVTGASAANYVNDFADVIISYDVAYKEFLDIELPKYVGLTLSHLPNFASLSKDCRGAMVSLVYNRGASFDVSTGKDPTGRYTEMRNIKQLMQDKEAWPEIPLELRKMKRLWPHSSGLQKRRELEALLFEKGLGSGD